jgi:hypothetical protein
MITNDNGWFDLLVGCLMVGIVAVGCDSSDATGRKIVKGSNATLQCLENGGYDIIDLKYGDRSNQIWLDRDLGAIEAAEESDNANAYSDLYHINGDEMPMGTRNGTLES